MTRGTERQKQRQGLRVSLLENPRAVRGPELRLPLLGLQHPGQCLAPGGLPNRPALSRFHKIPFQYRYIANITIYDDAIFGLLLNYFVLLRVFCLLFSSIFLIFFPGHTFIILYLKGGKRCKDTAFR